MGARAFTYRYLVHSGPGGGGPLCPLKLEERALSKKAPRIFANKQPGIPYFCAKTIYLLTSFKRCPKKSANFRPESFYVCRSRGLLTMPISASEVIACFLHHHQEKWAQQSMDS